MRTLLRLGLLFGLVVAGCSPVERQAGREIHVNGSDPGASDENSGTKDRPLRSIARAAQIAEPGDSVVIAGGIYRETVVPARGGEPGRPITYRAREGEEVVIRGSELWDAQWTRERGRVWSAPLDPGLFGDFNPFALAVNSAPGPYKELVVRPVPEGEPAVSTMGQVFVNGVKYRQVPNKERLRPRVGTWMVSPDGGSIVVHFAKGVDDPVSAEIGLSVRKQLFRPHRRGLGHIHLRDLIFDRAVPPGPMPQRGMVSARSGHHWLVEGCTFRDSMTVGFDCGGETGEGSLLHLEDTDEEDQIPIESHSHIFRRNLVVGNGICGVAALHIRNAIFYDNTFLNNAWILPDIADYKTARMTWNEWGGLKSHGFKEGVIAGNRFLASNRGLFLDTRFGGAIVTGNIFANNPAHSVILERSTGRVRIVNNVFVNNGGNDIRTMDMSDLLIANNLFASKPEATSAAIYFKFNFKPGKWRGGAGIHVAIKNNEILNNVFLGDKPMIEIPDVGIRDRFPDQYQFPRSDHNLLDRSGFLVHNFQIGKNDTISMEQPAPLDLTAWREKTGNDANSRDPASPLLQAGLKGSELTIEAQPAFFEIAAVPTEGFDFFGNAATRSPPLPGPFQTLVGGENRLRLWPPDMDDTRVEELINAGRIQEIFPNP